MAFANEDASTKIDCYDRRRFFELRFFVLRLFTALFFVLRFFVARLFFGDVFFFGLSSVSPPMIAPRVDDDLEEPSKSNLGVLDFGRVVLLFLTDRAAEDFPADLRGERLEPLRRAPSFSASSRLNSTDA